MAEKKNGVLVRAVIGRMLVDPRQRPSNILYLPSPCDCRLQAIIDDRYTYAVSSVKATYVAVRIGAAKLQSFVTAFPTAAVNKNQNRPASAFGGVEIQPMLAPVRIGTCPVAQLRVHLVLWQDRFSIEERSHDPFPKSLASRKCKCEQQDNNRF